MSQSHNNSNINSNIDISSLSFEAAMEKLEKVVEALEKGSLTLDDAMKYYSYGNKLHNHCSKKLEEAQIQVKNILHEEDKAVKDEDMSKIE